MFSQTRRIEYSHLAPDKMVSIPDMLRFMQDTAVAHTTACGYSLEKLSSLKRAWLLLSTHIIFNKPISFPADVKVTTWTYDFARSFGPRAFVISNPGTAEKYAEAATFWAYVDSETGVPKELPKDSAEVYGDDGASSVSYIRRAPCFEAKEHFVDFSVLKRDLDSNHHMNNVKYIEYALEAISDDLQILEIEIYYRHSAFWGEKISLFTEWEDESHIILNIKNKVQETCTYVRFTVRKR
ncbi:MAG: hypothetical protein IJN25_00515 [Clostridia bacterium]|nr:hypothetical protein [Clostridia bacterium]